MSIIYILIPIAILLTSVGIYLFFWAVKTEQFEDLEKQGMSILFDDEAQIKTIKTAPEQDQEEKVESADKSTDNK